MLLLAASMGQLSFEKLMQVYQGSNQKYGAAMAPYDSQERQLQLAEADFYDYLCGTFFSTPGARCAVWMENGEYLSALRLEPYQDGLLLEALETAPAARNRGYAVRLIQAVQALLADQGGVKLYSHVDKRNLPSLKVHKNAAFKLKRIAPLILTEAWILIRIRLSICQVEGAVNYDCISGIFRGKNRRNQGNLRRRGLDCVLTG